MSLLKRYISFFFSSSMSLFAFRTALSVSLTLVVAMSMASWVLWTNFRLAGEERGNPLYFLPMIFFLFLAIGAPFICDITSRRQRHPFDTLCRMRGASDTAADFFSTIIGISVGGSGVLPESLKSCVRREPAEPRFGSSSSFDELWCLVVSDIPFFTHFFVFLTIVPFLVIWQNSLWRLVVVDRLPRRRDFPSFTD